MENITAKSSPRKVSAMTIAGLGLLTAVIVVLQLCGAAIRFGPFSITLVLAPIVVGAALFGKWAGAWLGFVFSLVVLFTDAGAFLAVSVPGTVVTVLLKGTLAGFCAGLVYKLAAKKNSLAAVIAAGIVSPVVNTGIFVLGCFVFFFDTVSQWAEGFGFSGAFEYIIFGMVGLNFIIEAAINLLLSSAIVVIVNIGRKTFIKQ